jgi:hypothetical protein
VRRPSSPPRCEVVENHDDLAQGTSEEAEVESSLLVIRSTARIDAQCLDGPIISKGPPARKTLAALAVPMSILTTAAGPLPSLA